MEDRSKLPILDKALALIIFLTSLEKINGDVPLHHITGCVLGWGGSVFAHPQRGAEHQKSRSVRCACGPRLLQRRPSGWIPLHRCAFWPPITEMLNFPEYFADQKLGFGWCVVSRALLPLDPLFLTLYVFSSFYFCVACLADEKKAFFFFFFGSFRLFAEWCGWVFFLKKKN